MRSTRARRFPVFLVFLVPGLLLLAAPAQAGDGLPSPLLQVGIDQRVGQRVPLDVDLRDEAGQPVALREYFPAGGVRPVILVPAYYECPMLCTEVLNGVTGSLKALSLSAGRDFEVVTVSFDPRDTPALAAAKRQAYLRRYGRSPGPGGNPDPGWHFLTGEEPAIRRLMGAIGFRYAYDPQIRQYAHAAGIVVVTPAGQISRYFLGVDFPPRMLRLGLVEASAGKIGTAIDRLLLFCYRYDPTRGRYGALVMKAIHAGGALTLLALLSFIVICLRREARKEGA